MPQYSESILFSAIGVDKAERDVRRLDKALQELIKTSRTKLDPFTGVAASVKSARDGLSGVRNDLRGLAGDARKAETAISRALRAATMPRNSAAGGGRMSRSGVPLLGSGAVDPVKAALAAEREAERHRVAMARITRREERDAAGHAARMATIDRRAARDEARGGRRYGVGIGVGRAIVGTGGLTAKEAVLAGGGALTVKAGVSGAMHAVTDYSSELARVKIEAGADAGTIVPMVEKAAADIASAVPQLTKAEAIARIREQFGVTADWHHAIDQASAGAKRNAVLKSVTPGLEDPTLPLSKAAEQLLGKRMMTPEGQDIANRLKDAWTKTLIEQKGALHGRDILNMVSQSGSSLRAKYDLDKPADIDRMISDIGYKAPIMAGEMSGFRVGTMFSSMSRAMNGRMTDAAKGQFEDLGLIDPSKVVSRNKAGKPHELAYGAFIGSDQSLFDYAINTLTPALKKADAFDDTKKRDFYIDQLASNVNVARGLKMILNDYDRIAKSEGNIRRMANIDEAYQILKGDIATSREGAKGSLGTLSQTFLEPLITPVTTAFNSFAATIKELSDRANTPEKALAADAAGLATLVAGAVAKHVWENPAQAAQTAATTGLTAAIVANTAAVSANTGVKGVARR